MDILVLLKQVPDTETMIEIAEDQTRIETKNVKWIINPYDEFAVEEALRIKEKQGSGKITVCSAGTERTVAAIRSALAMGADEGLLIDDPACEESDALSTARILAAAIRTIHFDLIIAGQRSVSDENYQVPSAVAEFLGIPQIAMVVKQEISGGKILCEQTVTGGTAVIEADLPVLFTTQKGLNEPRYASMPNIMKAKKKPLAKKTLADIGISPAEVGKACAKAKILRLSFPIPRKAGIMIEGETPEQKAAILVKLLREKAKVI